MISQVPQAKYVVGEGKIARSVCSSPETDEIEKRTETKGIRFIIDFPQHKACVSLFFSFFSTLYFLSPRFHSILARVRKCRSFHFLQRRMPVFPFLSLPSFPIPVPIIRPSDPMNPPRAPQMTRSCFKETWKGGKRVVKKEAPSRTGG